MGSNHIRAIRIVLHRQLRSREVILTQNNLLSEFINYLIKNIIGKAIYANEHVLIDLKELL